MARARVWLVRAAIVGAALGVAACDAASTVASPRAAGASSRDASAASGTTTTTTTMSTMSDTTVTCRSGYQIAYRSDGTAYCVAPN